MESSSNGSLSELRIISIIAVFSLSIYLILMSPGLFATDENANLLLSRSIAEGLSLKLDKYFMGRSFFEPLALPPSFSLKEEHVYVGVDIGYPLMSSPFYRIFGLKGLQIFNAIVTSVTLVMLYYGALRIWGSREASFFSVILYLFCTYSLFYSTSLWHHALATMGFIGAQISWLYLDKGAKHQALFLLTSVIAISAAFYILLPIGILFVYALKKKLGNGFVFSLFLISILAIFWYNLQTSFSILGANARDLGFSFSTAIYNFIRMVIYREYAIDPWDYYWKAQPWGYYWTAQKSILESSPFLVTSFFSLFYLRKKDLIIPNLLYLIMILFYTPPDYGGANINMRYLLPVLPFMTLLSAGFIIRFYKDYKSMVLPLLIFTIYSYFSPTIALGSPEYIKLKILSFSLGIVLFISSLAHIQTKSRVTRYLLILILIGSLILSNFFSVYDLKMGNLKRSQHRISQKTLMDLTNEGDTIIVPNFSPWDRTMIEDRIMFYYLTPYDIEGYDDRGIMLNDLIEKSVFLNKRVHLVFWVGDGEIKKLALNFSGNFFSIDKHFSMVTLENHGTN